LENFVQIKKAAHPTTLVHSLTVDLNTGEVYELYDLFKNMSAHGLRITDYILREIEKKQIPLITDLRLIPDNHVYYLTEVDLVVYFREGELTSCDYGILEFAIPYYYLSSIVDKASPLERLLNNV